MKHYLKKLEDTIRSNWEQKALCDYGGEQFTYGDIATQIEQFRLFLDEAGISKGEKIALFGRNSARWAMTFWGVNANGRVAVPLLADFHPDSIQALVNHSDSVLLFTDEDIWSRLRPESMPLLKAAIDIRSGRLLWYADETAAEAWENREAAFRLRFPEGMRLEQISIPEHDMGEVAIINYTSGTTGNPKGVMLTYGALSDTDDFSNSHFPNHPGETIVSMLPLAHMYGHRVHPPQHRRRDGIFPGKDAFAYDTSQSDAAGAPVYGSHGAAGDGEGLCQFHQTGARENEGTALHPRLEQTDLQDREKESGGRFRRQGRLSRKWNAASARCAFPIWWVTG